MPIDLNQPQIAAALYGGTVAAVVSLAIAGINQFSIWSMHRERVAGERALAERKISADLDLAERRFKFDQGLAERRFAYEREFNDHKRRVELAEQLLADFLQMRAIVREIRSSIVLESEGQDRPAWHEEETDRQAERRKRFFVPISRLLKHSEFINALMARRHQMNAYFGPAIESPFDKIWHVLARIQSSSRSMMMSVGADGVGRSPVKLWKEWESAIWADLEKPDPHAAAMDAAVAEVEAICRPVLAARIP